MHGMGLLQKFTCSVRAMAARWIVPGLGTGQKYLLNGIVTIAPVVGNHIWRDFFSILAQVFIVETLAKYRPKNITSK